MQVKKAIRYGVIALLIAGLNQACEAQSKEETLQWIKTRLPYASATGEFSYPGYENTNTQSIGYGDVVVKDPRL